MGPAPAFQLTADHPRTVDVPAPPAASRRHSVGRALTGFRDSCVLCGAALLACLALIAVGTIGSLLWTAIVER